MIERLATGVSHALQIFNIHGDSDAKYKKQSANYNYAVSIQRQMQEIFLENANTHNN